MHRLLLLAIIATVGAVSAQDTSTDDQAASEPAPATTAETVEGVSDEVLGSQDDHIEEDEDVFKPTDVVSYAQSVPFPVDI
ncbi:MAG: hypothetical protein OEY74_08025 [Gammaproteobacteria bacterium]|nr:hypothetical protein [Gammaproteobacteria bacterium]